MNDITISHPATGEIEATLRLAFSHLTEPEHSLRTESILRQIQSGKIDPAGVFQAEKQDVRIGALFAQKRFDGTVFLWPPTLRDDAPPDCFYEPLDRFCRENAAAAALMMADRGQRIHRPSTRAAGFEALSDLLQMVADVPGSPSPGEFSCNFVPMKDDGDSFRRMVRMTAETYRETRDFPRLLNVMSVEGVLSGYRDIDEYRPDLWFFAQKSGRDVGVLLLTDFPDTQLELTYMGLAPDARGTGLGKELVRFTFDLAARSGRDYVITSVDEQNPAALKSYLALGFQTWDRKRIYAKFY